MQTTLLGGYEGKNMRASLALLWVLICVSSASAQVLYSDGFEGYNSGALDANLSGGPNQAPNGGPGNPWFGPVPPNLDIVGAGGGISSGSAGPHSESKMVSADPSNYADQDSINLAHRLNGGNSFTGNFRADWWFYDPTGAGNDNYRDYAELVNYPSASAGAASGLDYPVGSGGNVDFLGARQSLALGASNEGFNATMYQARVVGATDGLNGGWFNVGRRSVGWHEGTITLGADQGLNTLVSFYIDGSLVLSHPIMTTGGVNVFEMNSRIGTTAANYDDVSFSAVPEPTAMLIVAATPLALRRRRMWSGSSTR